MTIVTESKYVPYAKGHMMLSWLVIDREMALDLAERAEMVAGMAEKAYENPQAPLPFKHGSWITVQAITADDADEPQFAYCGGCALGQVLMGSRALDEAMEAKAKNDAMMYPGIDEHHRAYGERLEAGCSFVMKVIDDMSPGASAAAGAVVLANDTTRTPGTIAKALDGLATFLRAYAADLG